MKLRCPYCKFIFPALQEGRCPSCGKALRVGERDAEPKKPWKSMRNPKGKPPPQRPPFLMLPWLVFAGRPRRALLSITLAGTVIASLLLTRMQMDPNNPREPAKVSRARAELGVLRTALEWFCASCNRYPTSEEGLKALVRNPGVPGWDGYYIDSLYPDPWNHPYQYAWSNNAVTLFSLGADGAAQTADDIPAPAPDFKAIMERVLPGE